MQLPLEITFRNMDQSDAVEAKVRSLAEKLERYNDKIMACRVVIEASHKHKSKGGVYHTRIDVTVPGNEIVINREAHKNQAHSDVYVAIRDAFNAAYRKLEVHRDKRQGKVKTHEEPPQGKISFISHEEGYGRIVTNDGREIYFHENSLINKDFAKLKIDDAVRFSEEDGIEGPQASSLRTI